VSFRSFGLIALLASAAAWGAMMAWVILLGGHHRKFMAIMTFVMPFACFFGLNTAYLLLQGWFRLALPRFLAAGFAAGAAAYVMRGNQWNWHPVFASSPRTALLLIGFPVAGALAYWAVLRRLAPELGET
jgi:hypothetical protein